MDNTYIEELGKKAQSSAPFLANCGTALKNRALAGIGKALAENKEAIFEGNGREIENGRANGMR